MPCTEDATQLRSDELGPLPGQCEAQSTPGGDGTFATGDTTTNSPPDDTSSTPGESDPSASPSPSPSTSPSPTEDEEDDGGGGLLSELGDLLSGIFG